VSRESAFADALVPALLGLQDCTDLAEHYHRMHALTDALGVPLHAPVSPLTLDRETWCSAWARPVTEPGWARVFGVRDGLRGPVIAHLDLRGAETKTKVHRARIALGVEPSYQRRGLGEKLMCEAIAFAEAAGLAWLDLWVFSHNAPAQTLYRKLGFFEIGRYPDQFRVGSASIEDIAMVLPLGRHA
jgi:GNAT superfamily N-acetyltransferase